MPRHIAIVMDGNGRWAKARFMPRLVGHKKGVETVRKIIRECSKQGVAYLTLFAFSSENWKRPAEEVSGLMSLFMVALNREIEALLRNNVRLQFIGDRAAFSPELQERIAEAEQRTAESTGLHVLIAANYGGRWDIVQAAERLCHSAPHSNTTPRLSEQQFAAQLSTANYPDPDLFIRTGGEKRISNFLIWQLAYAELYFTDVLWPDFDEAHLQTAIHDFSQRQRRFGMTGDQVQQQNEGNHA
ncbi:MAG TPA: isoprenyl transferase [Thiothrix sp.]|nr:isoprenyl transferase [Thiothrix sp.]